MKKYGAASLLTVVVGILAIIARIVYLKVINTADIVSDVLYVAIAVAIVGLLLVQVLPRVSNYVPILLAALLGYAAVAATNPMVNQIGWVIAGLDAITVLISYIWFIGCTVGGMMVAIIAAFLPMAKPKPAK